MAEYNHEFDLRNFFAEQNRLIKTPKLFNFDKDQLYAAAMDMLAQPLPNGEASPFSSRTPGTAHAILVGMLLHFLELQGQESNYMPDIGFLKLLRMHGVEMEPAEYPIINIVFERSEDAYASGIPVEIPLGTQIQSNVNPSLSAFTVVAGIIDGDKRSILVPARLNQIGQLPNLRVGELSRLPSLLSFIAQSYNDGTVVSPGRDAETIIEATLRAREEFKTGRRCITLTDYFNWAERLGADLGITKVNVLPRYQHQTQGDFWDLVTVVVYPGTYKDLLQERMLEYTPAAQRFSVIEGEVIPVDGLIEVRADGALSDGQVRDMAAKAIVEEINPPFGKWGDVDFDSNLATAIERVQGIYAVPTVALNDVRTSKPLAETKVEAWQILEVQESIQIRNQR